MIKLDQISLPIKYTNLDIEQSVCRALKIKKEDIVFFEILKLSIDARKKPNIKYIASLGVNLKNNLENKFAKLKYEKNDKLLKYSQLQSNKKIIVVGFGPSGIFASLALARMGLKPIIIEQGKQVEEREKDVLAFWNDKKLNRYSNVQFGEGGAGTFSDGKLNSNLNNDYCKMVINEFYSFGAPKEITYINKPHIGSDNLKNIVKNIREHIKELGGVFMFSTKLKDIILNNNAVSEIVVENVEENFTTNIKCDYLVLCVGHSARETFEMLYNKGVKIKQKPFAMGVRIEHKQSDINLSQYGKEHIDGLPNADYKLVSHLPNGRSVFTFCMCPGGQVVASSSNEGEIVTNGMSNFSRDKENANSAVLVNITPDDYKSDNPLAGIYYQAKYEKMAFELGGKNYNAPAESVGSFVYNKKNKPNINFTYKPNITLCKIEQCLPEIVSESLKLGLQDFNKKIKNFAKDENLLIAIESRSSCPLTILRNENFESNVRGLYPVGEGAGYAGGIMSSGQDGIKVAEAIYKNIKDN